MIACQAGVMRRVGDIKDGKAMNPTYGVGQDDAWTCDIEGAAGEMAVAKWMRTYWNGNIGNLKADDVGPFQVRTTAHPRGRLCLHKRDNPDKTFIHVRGVAPSFELVGWIVAREGMLEDYWKDPTGRERWAYFVPNAALRPMEELTMLEAA
jgi:hypothetical protein